MTAHRIDSRNVTRRFATQRKGAAPVTAVRDVAVRVADGEIVAIMVSTIIGIVAYGAVVLAERKVLHYIPRAQHKAT